MAASTEARELELVNKVSLRIGLAKDSSLEKLLDTYLIPLLLKLASDHVSVRNEVCMALSACKAKTDNGQVINMGQHLKIRLSGNE